MKFTLILLSLVISFGSRGQLIVKGVVYDKVEPAIPGVIVTELGTDNKVMTDVKGEFEIKTTSKKPTLIFTFVGFVTQTVKVKKNRFLKVKLKWTKFAPDIAMRFDKEATTANTMYVP